MVHPAVPQIQRPQTMAHNGGYCAQPPRSKSHGTQASPPSSRGTVHGQGLKSWGDGFIRQEFCLAPPTAVADIFRQGINDRFADTAVVCVRVLNGRFHLNRCKLSRRECLQTKRQFQVLAFQNIRRLRPYPRFLWGRSKRLNSEPLFKPWCCCRQALVFCRDHAATCFAL